MFFFLVHMPMIHVRVPHVKVGMFNWTGSHYKGSYDVWLWNHLSWLLDSTTHVFIEGALHSMTGWVNGNDYTCSAEVFGILPVDRSTQNKLGMLEYCHEHATTMKIQFADLAQQQGTCSAVLPVHTAVMRMVRVWHRNDAFSVLFVFSYFSALATFQLFWL